MILPNAAESTALFIVDAQPKTFSGAAAFDVVGRIEAHISKHRYNAYVIAEYHASEDSMFYKQQDWLLSPEEAGQTCSSLSSVLRPFIDDVIKIRKNKRSCFKCFDDRNLTTFLKEREITEIHLVGFDINDCVIATAYDSLDTGYYTFVLEELCGHHENNKALSAASLTLLRYQHMTNNSLHNKIPYKTVDL